MGSPFPKEDLVRQGAYSLSQISAILESRDFAEEAGIRQETVQHYTAAGVNISYLRYPREAFRKGISPMTGTIFTGYGEAIKSLDLESASKNK